MSKTVTLAASCVGAQLINADREIKLFVSGLLSYQVEGAEYSNAFQAGAWDGRSSFFQWLKARFPAGFAMPVHDALVAQGYKVHLVRKPVPKPKGPEKFHLFGGRGTDPRYDYQAEVVHQLIRHRIGIARVATGGGKSHIATLAIHRIRRMTLFLTTRSVLMYQMADNLKEHGFGVGILGDGEFTPRAINCAMVQTLIARLKEPEPDDHSPPAERQRKVRRQTIKLLEMVEFVIGEEAHEAGGNSYFEILRHCRNAHYRLALTATPFMRPDAEANMRLMAAFGPIISEVSEKMLIDRGILATPYFKIMTPECPKRLYKSTSWQRARKIGIVENESRNRMILDEAARAVRLGLPVLVLVQLKAHGKILEELLTKAGIKTRFIFGESDRETRQDALNALGRGHVQTLIGSSILDVGVDVPAMGMVILAGGGKAEVAMRQRIGRGLREKKKGPNVAFIVDFNDKHNSHLRDHSRERRAILEGTPGFAERIIPDGSDFDFKALGFTLAA